MRKIFGLALAATLLLTACGTNEEELARPILAAAERAFAAGNFNEAKLQVDSIRHSSPKAFETRRAAIRLMQRVELEEQRQVMAYLDSLLLTKEEALEKVKGRFVLEKVEEYQEVGNYFAPSQRVEKNLGRSYLRAQVSELGAMSLTSVYCGTSPLHHTVVRVSSGNTFAETPPTADLYESQNLGVTTEKADFPLGNDGDVIRYIAVNAASPIKVELRGERTIKMAMSDADRKALAALNALSQLLPAIEEIRASQAEAQRKMAFVESNMKAADEE